jgi:septum site-determining protein MinC
MADILEFKSSQLSSTVVKVHDTDMGSVAALLEKKLAKAGRFLKGAAIIIEPSCLLNVSQLTQLLALLRQYEMIPVAIRTIDEYLIEYAQRAGLVVVKSLIEEKNKPNIIEENTLANIQANILTTAKKVTNIRSGQLEKHMLGDFLVTGNVNSGSELYAGGHITILGSARGRIHAGAAGNREARIISRDFNPELVSISGVFLLSDDIPNKVKKGWVEVYLEEQTLRFNSLD